MTPLLDDLTNSTELSWQIIALRLAGAVLLCGLIGFEREARGRAAGLRTHMLVGLAAALYCLIMLEVLARADDYSQGVAMDPLRLVEAVTGGVAFLAAGMIVFSQGKVRGLTTGASLWLAAAIGLGTGFGMWVMTLMATALALAIIRILKAMEDRARDRLNEATDDRD